MSDLATLSIIAALFVFFAPAAHAANITVNSSCTLDNAIKSANGNSSVGGCTAGSGDDTITLTADVTLSAELTALNSNITLQGAGYAIDGDEQYRILDTGGATVTINNVTIKDGAGPAQTNGGGHRRQQLVR